MSNKALNYVWENSKQTGSARVLMLAIADMSNDDGECYPGNARLAEKVLCSERNLQKLVDKCETDGELMVVEHGGTKTKNGWTNRYIIVGMSKKTPLEVNARTPRPSRDVKSDTPRDVKPDVSRGVNVDTQNPQKNPQKNQEIKRGAKAPARNLHFDELVKLFGIDYERMTKSEKTAYGKVANELKAAGVQPDELCSLHAYVSKLAQDQKWNGFTIHALAAHNSNWRRSQSGGNKPNPMQGLKPL